MTEYTREIRIEVGNIVHLRDKFYRVMRRKPEQRCSTQCDMYDRPRCTAFCTRFRNANPNGDFVFKEIPESTMNGDEVVVETSYQEECRLEMEKIQKIEQMKREKQLKQITHEAD